VTVTHEWFKALECRHDEGSVFFDLKKAFDSIPHQLLMDYLHGYGLDVNTLAWIHSYLTNRKLHHVIDCSASSDMPVVSGVPQDSVLGPLLSLSISMTSQLLVSQKGVPSISLLMTCFSLRPQSL